MICFLYGTRENSSRFGARRKAILEAVWWLLCHENVSAKATNKGFKKYRNVPIL
jgi:hypothetical protein